MTVICTTQCCNLCTFNEPSNSTRFLQVEINTIAKITIQIQTLIHQPHKKNHSTTICERSSPPIKFTSLPLCLGSAASNNLTLSAQLKLYSLLNVGTKNNSNILPQNSKNVPLYLSSAESSYQTNQLLTKSTANFVFPTRFHNMTSFVRISERGLQLDHLPHVTDHGR